MNKGNFIIFGNYLFVNEHSLMTKYESPKNLHFKTLFDLYFLKGS